MSKILQIFKIERLLFIIIFISSGFIFINIADAAYIKDDINGGDCGLIGVWDLNTKTCSLTTDLNDSIIIANSGITLDGGNHQLIGDNIGSGIIIDYWKNAVVKNLKIRNFAYGIDISNSENNLITGNIISDNSEAGIVLLNSHGNLITENTISNNQFGLGIWYIYMMSENKVYRNNFLNNSYQIYAMFDENDFFYQTSPIGGNYWSDFDTSVEGCADLDNDNFCDSPYVFIDGQDNLPWTKQDGWKITQNQPPTFLNLNQYKSDGIATTTESGITTEDRIIFKATLNDSDNDQAKLQVELKESNQPFDGAGIIESGFVSSGTVASITRYGLIDGQYHWRSRAVDDKGNASDWQEFGTAGNVDFEVHTVPLYTQVESDFPSLEKTRSWYDKDYAQGSVGNYSCGSKIYQCGCAITSGVMIARYYGVTETQGKDVNPGEINEWLKNEPDGYFKGNVNWMAIARYTGNWIKYQKTSITTNDYALLDEKLNNNQPVIAKANSGRGGINREHFFVIDGKLALTYTIKDPAWYNTKKLNETTDSVNKIRGYGNGFDGLRIYKKGDGLAQGGITIALGSPAELLLTDSQGRKLGKDANGVEYNEIPNTSYFQDGFDDPTGENPPSQERSKLIYVLEPIDGVYQLQVIGTGQGNYSLDSNAYDTQGGVNHQGFHSETAPGYTAQYNLNFDSANSSSTTVKLFDETPPEAEIYFDQTTQNLMVKGTDNTTVNPTVSVTQNNEKETIYQIKDEAGNTAKLFFDKIKQEGKEIKAELKSIQYNNQPVVDFSKTEFKYEWSIDEKTNAIKNLEQRIKVRDQFDVKAKYNSEKNETTIKIKVQNQDKAEQIIPGFAIFKLITKLGVLDFEY